VPQPQARGGLRCAGPLSARWRSKRGAFEWRSKRGAFRMEIETRSFSNGDRNAELFEWRSRRGACEWRSKRGAFRMEIETRSFSNGDRNAELFEWRSKRGAFEWRSRRGAFRALLSRSSCNRRWAAPCWTAERLRAGGRLSVCERAGGWVSASGWAAGCLRAGGWVCARPACGPRRRRAASPAARRNAEGTFALWGSVGGGRRLAIRLCVAMISISAGGRWAVSGVHAAA
jgi:hypothetical protein